MAGRERFIYDDDGEPMRPGSLVLVNGIEERVISFDRRGEIRINDWPDDDFIFSVERIERDDQRDDWPEEI